MSGARNVLHRSHRSAGGTGRRLRAARLAAFLGAAALAGCASSAGGSGSSSSLRGLNLGSVSTAGWIAHVARGGGVVLTFRTPPTWSHFYPAPFLGPARSTWSDFAIPPPCASNDTAPRCSLGYGGRLVLRDGSLLSVSFLTPSPATTPSPYAKEQGEASTTIAGFPAVALVKDDTPCTSLGAPITFAFQVSVWIPSGVQLNFCVNGPDIEHQEAVAATIAASASFKPDRRSAAEPVVLFGATTTTGGFARSSRLLPYCTQRQLSPSVSAVVHQHNGRTTIGVATSFRQATSARCGLPPLSTCGTYGDFAVYGPSRRVLWTWEPTTLGVECFGGVWRLPVTIKVPQWSVPTRLLATGTYEVRMVSIVNGIIEGPVLASTMFHVT